MTFLTARRRCRTLNCLLTVLALICLLAPPAAAAQPRVGFLVARGAMAGQGAETRAAADLAGKLATSTVLRPAGAAFVDADGKRSALGDLPVLWYHQGDDNAASGPMYAAKTLAALKDYVSKGGGLYLSGAALGMVHNHPSGDATPSVEDLRITRQMIDAGKVVDIKVLDHCVIGRGKDGEATVFSMRENGLLAF